MPKDKNVKKKRNNPVVRYMIYCIIVAALFTGISFSRYSTETPAGDSARVAKLNVSITHSAWTGGEYYDETVNAAGASVSYTFTVTNNSEVPVRVRLVIDSSDIAVSADTVGWFDLDLGAAKNVTLTTTGKMDGNNVKCRFEYEQII